MKINLKKITAGAALLALMCAAGCSKNADVNVKGLAEHIINNVPFSEELSEAPQSVALARYDIDESIVTEGVYYKGTSAVVDELAVIKTTDADTVEKKMLDYADKQTELYESYAPDQAEKMDSMVIYTYNDTVVYCISDDHDAAQKAVIDYTAK